MIDVPNPQEQLDRALAEVKSIMPQCSIVCGRVGEDHVITDIRGDLVDLMVCLGKVVAKLATDAESRYGVPPHVVVAAMKASMAHAMGEEQ